MGFSAVFGFFCVCAFPFLLHTGGNGLGYTNSIFSFLLWLALLWFFNGILKRGFTGKWSKWLIPFVFSLFFVLALVFGAQLDSRGSVPFTEISMWLSVFVLTAAFSLSVRYGWDRLAGLSSVRRGKEADKKEKKDTGGREFFLTAGFIFLCYLPVFLAVYPGFFVYDAQDELMQVITRSFSTHHPLLHVLLTGGIIQLVYKLSGSYNLGIACYTLFQMLVLSGIFSFAIGTMKKKGVSLTGRILTAAYFGLFPVVVMFSLCSAKDGLFTGMLLLMFLLLQELCRTPEEFFEKKGKLFLLWAASVGMMMLRHNGFYAFGVFAVLLLVILRKYFKKLVLLLGGIFVCYFAASGILTAAFHADASENQELLTVPIQQLARVYQREGDRLPEEDKALLYEILPEKALTHYTPKVSDSVKQHFNNAAYEKDKGKYLGLWLKWGVRHPFTYLNAWFMTSYGFWYPDTVIDVYRGNSVFTFTYEDSSYFGFEVEEPGVRESKLPWLMEAYRRMSLEITQQKLPVVSMLFSPGFLFWATAFVLCFFWYVNEKKRLTPYLLLFLVWLTVLLGPTYLVRYVVFLWFVLPFTAAELWDYRRSR